MSSTPPLSDDREALAAEYALGLLEGEDLVRAVELNHTDSAFQAAVARWTERFAPMLDAIAPVAPPAAAFAGIERRIDALATSSGDNVIRLRSRLNRWRMMAGGASALAASLAIVLVMRPPIETAPSPIPSGPPAVAIIEGESGAARLVAMWQKDERKLTVFPAAVLPADPNHSHELWIIPSDGRPRSIGLVPEGTMNVTVDDDIAEHLVGGVTLAVSLEPAGGSPTGAPTGPVLASGKLQQG